MAAPPARQPLLRIALLAILACLAAKPAEPAPFVKATGTAFTIGGRPYYVTGVNNHYLPFGSETEVKRVLDDAVAIGANTVRTFLQPVIGSLDGKVPTIWAWKSTADSSDLNVHGNYLLYWDDKTGAMGINRGPNGIGKIDFLIAEAKKRHLRLIISFLDFWSYTGGIQQMRAWYGSESKNHFFFVDPRTRRDYRRWVAYVVNHRNPLTGLRYRDDPTIMAWELANEANAEPESLRMSWTADMAAWIKSQDPNHLVASGNANPDPTQTDIAIPDIDFLTWHGYPKYLGIGVNRFDRLIRRYCELAPAYHKPVLLEEFGFARSNPDQAQAYARWLKTLADDRDCAGWLVWRLVGRQDDGKYPVDDYPDAQFDVRRNEPALWNAIAEATRGREPQPPDLTRKN